MQPGMPQQPQQPGMPMQLMDPSNPFPQVPPMQDPTQQQVPPMPGQPGMPMPPPVPGQAPMPMPMQPQPGAPGQPMPAYMYPPSGAYPYAPMPPPPMQSAVTVTKKTEVVKSRKSGHMNEILTYNDICSKCEPPHFLCCQFFFGLCTMLSCGGALQCGTICCCYGCGRPSCCQVWCGGFCLGCTSPCIYGIVASCCVGCAMMGSPTEL